MGEDKEAVEFVSVGLETFCSLLLLGLLLFELLFLLFLSTRLNSGGRRCLDCCCVEDLFPLIVKGIGGFSMSSFEIPLKAEVAPTLMLLLLVMLMAAMPFVLESESGMLLSSFSSPTLSMDEKLEERMTSKSSDGSPSMTLSNFVDGNPEEEATPKASCRCMYLPSESIVECFGRVGSDSKLS